MKPAIEPNAAFHFAGTALLHHLERFEANDQRCDYFIVLARGDRQRDDLVDCFLGGSGTTKEVPHLGCLG